MLENFTPSDLDAENFIFHEAPATQGIWTG